MYSDEDLDQAVEKGIFTAESVQTFRNHALEQSHTHVADEENFRLIASFNDIFVVIACLLLLLSSGVALHHLHPAFSGSGVAALSWGLAEFFVLKRKMALPAIVLLATFVGGVFAAVLLAFEQKSETVVMLAACAASIAAFLHWRRFSVPITVAAGAASVVTFVIALLLSVFPGLEAFLMPLLFIGGCLVFALAMYWDSADLERVTGKSDVAFWLHLTAAPLIVHPVIIGLGIFEGNESLLNLVVIVLLYVLLTLISITIDRRAFMVSSLAYVLVAIAKLLETCGMAGDNFAYVGVFIGFSLLLLSGFWHKVRGQIVVKLPLAVRQRVPEVR